MYSADPDRIAKIIRLARKRLNYTQEELGEAINKSKSTINKYENGLLRMDLETIVDMCNILGLDIRNLVEEDVNPDSINQTGYNKNPFGSDNLFIYYIGFNLSIVTSYIRLEESKRSIKAYMKNPINKKDNINGALSFEYEGSIGSDQKVAIITLRNDEVINKSFEKVMITITLKFTKDNYYLGSISALLDNQKPTVRKCILTKERLEGKQLEDIFKLLEISDEEYSQMKKDMFWNPETYAIEDYSTKVIK